MAIVTNCHCVAKLYSPALRRPKACIRMPQPWYLVPERVVNMKYSQQGAIVFDIVNGKICQEMKNYRSSPEMLRKRHSGVFRDPEEDHKFIWMNRKCSVQVTMELPLRMLEIRFSLPSCLSSSLSPTPFFLFLFFYLSLFSLTLFLSFSLLDDFRTLHVLCQAALLAKPNRPIRRYNFNNLHFSIHAGLGFLWRLNPIIITNVESRSVLENIHSQFPHSNRSNRT